MKKVIVIILSVLLTGAAGIGYAGAKNTKVNRFALESVIQRYKSHKNFEVMKIGGLLMKFAQTAAETEEEKRMLRGIKGLTVVNFEDCNESVARDFKKAISDVLRNYELLMESKEDGELVRIYGNTSDDGQYVNDMIVLADETMVCVFGTINISDVGQFSKMDD